MPGGAPTVTEFYLISGDSIVNEVQYKKVWYSNDSLTNQHFQYLVREESNLVFILLNNQTEAILYDFDLNIGEEKEIYNPFTQEYSIISVDSIFYITYDNFHRMVYRLGGEYEEYWIEGIGSTLGPFNSRVYDFIMCPDWKMVCAYEQNEQIYQWDGYPCYEEAVGIAPLDHSQLQMYPNPVLQGDVFHIESQHPLKSMHIFDISGKLILSKSLEERKKAVMESKDLKKGVYLIKLMDSNGLSYEYKLLVK